ncbi:MAG TPA: hydrogenase iron-sulfur subunit [Anaerolineae bacterium]|nr:hydrogenase iron-sulfur subunit [Anaerolineae bacterium]
MTDDFEPKIIVLVCNWCTYTAADLAGTSRLAYPANIRIIRLMCTGMIDSKYILKAFLDGADGVFIGGCHPGDCHYINGNLKAKKRISGIRKIVEQFGFDPKRLRLRWIGASEGPEFQQNMTEFVESIKALGPTSVKDRMIL